MEPVPEMRKSSWLERAKPEMTTAPRYPPVSLYKNRAACAARAATRTYYPPPLNTSSTAPAKLYGEPE
jgi:hypothetical protein